MKFAVFYGVPTYREDNTWLHEELSKYGETRVVDVSDFWYKIGRWHQRSKIGILLHAFMYVIHALTIIINTNKNEIIVTRDHGSSLVLAWIIKTLNIKRIIIAFNWIEIPKKHYKYLAHAAFYMANYIPVVNDYRLMEKLRTGFAINKEKMLFFPDIYNTREKFIVPRTKKERYIFSGGTNNRDWDLLLKVARLNSDKKFKIVVNKYCWTYKVEYIPDNVTMFYDLTEKEYYQLMKEAFITIIPLKEDRVSGLINIIRSHQYGVPCITNNMGVTSLYYPSKYKNIMLYTNGFDDLDKKINRIYDMKENIYIELATDLQLFLRNEFNPQKKVGELSKQINDWLRRDG